MIDNLHILIIDDDKIDRMAIGRALKQASSLIKITEVDNAKDGILLAKELYFDVILLDFRLPDIDGIEVLMELRHADSNNVTVVMLSRQDDEFLAEMAIRQGAQDFLLKDEVTPRRLIRAVHQAQHRFKLEEDLRQSHKKLKQLAEQDALTGLANRYEFECALQYAVTQAKQHNTSLAVLLLDIDHFKQVNDTFGHNVGDKLLVEVSSRLQKIVHESNSLARLGGDEFILLIQNLADVNQALDMANAIVNAFSHPLDFNESGWVVTTSVGISTLGESANSASELIKCADIAMYRAKQEGRNQAHFYSTELHSYIMLRSILEQDIRAALAADQFRLAYHAQICSQTGALVGMEALLRWQHPTRGLLGPIDFLDLAEELGLMVDIGAWVLTQACTQLVHWHTLIGNSMALPMIAVNLSPVQLYNKKLAKCIDNVLKETGLNPKFLELEITESAIIKNPEKVAVVLRAIANSGVHLALDDFGTGFSSFEHLKLFPIHNLKIDRSFVSEIGNNTESESLLAAMINFARTLKLTVVAEGVETAEQARFCKDNGADIIQGYYYAKPMLAKDFENHFLSDLNI